MNKKVDLESRNKVSTPYLDGGAPAAPPSPGRRASAKAILNILGSRASHKGVKKQFDRLLSDSSRELAAAVASVPNPSNPYMALVRLPTAFSKLQWLSSRKIWYRKIVAFRRWIRVCDEQREVDANRLRAALKIQNWAQFRFFVTIGSPDRLSQELVNSVATVLSYNKPRHLSMRLHCPAVASLY